MTDATSSLIVLTTTPTIGFVCFGEAAFHIAKGLREAGISAIFGYDIHADTPGRGELIRRRADEASRRMAPSLMRAKL